MKQLSTYINESVDKFRPTKEWMEEHYNLYNERYFNNELPKPGKVYLEVVRSKGSELGCQGEYVKWYTSSESMENDHYIMYTIKPGKYAGWTSTFKNGRWKSEILINDNLERVNSIVDLKPFIRINGIYLVTENNVEDTLIHEMVHLWTYKDGLAPKQAHGKEFKKKCNEIRKIAKEKYGDSYELTTKARSADGFELDERGKQKQQAEINRLKKMGGGVVGVYIIFDADKMKENKLKYPERFFFCTKSMLTSLIRQIKSWDEVKYLTNIYVSEDSYEKMCNKYGKFKTIRRYQYWSAEYYSAAKDIMVTGAKDIHSQNESLNESKKPYIKPMTRIIEIPSEINLSDINIEDIVNAMDDSVEQEGTKENDKKLINP